MSGARKKGQHAVLPSSRVLVRCCFACCFFLWIIFAAVTTRTLTFVVPPGLRAAQTLKPLFSWPGALTSHFKVLRFDAGADIDLCFVIRVMPSHVPNLPALLFSLFASGYSRIRPIVLRTYNSSAHPGDGVADVVRLVNSVIPGDLVELSEIDARDTFIEYPELLNRNWAADGGYVATDKQLEAILRRRAADPSYCEAIVVTNGDNLYGSGFIKAVLEQFRNGYNLVATYFVSRYFYDDGVRAFNNVRGRGPCRSGSDVEFVTTFARGGIDLGAAAFRTELLERTGVRFISTRLERDPSAATFDLVQVDGYFFEDLVASPYTRSTVVPRTLYLHQ